MFGILMALGIVFVLYAAFLYLIAQGNDEKLKGAKNVLIYSVVALVVGVLVRIVGKIRESANTPNVDPLKSKDRCQPESEIRVDPVRPVGRNQNLRQIHSQGGAGAAAETCGVDGSRNRLTAAKVSVTTRLEKRNASCKGGRVAA